MPSLYEHLMRVLVNCDEANSDEVELYNLVAHELAHWLRMEKGLVWSTAQAISGKLERTNDAERNK